MAGKELYYSFTKKYADLRSAESTSLQRATGFNQEQVDQFFEKRKELMDKFALKPSRIFNADETGVTVVYENQLKVISVKGKKPVGKLIFGERSKNFTVILCINASGDQFVPPLFVFPRVRMDNDLIKDAPDGSVFDVQPSAWIIKDGFLKWENSFANRVNPIEERPVLLIVGGHSTKKKLEVILFARS